MQQVKSPRTIVILRALQLGDLLCAVPAFRALRSGYPDAHISLVGLPWAEGFVRRFSVYLDDFIPFPGWPGLPEQPAQLAQIPVFLQEMQQRKFDLALQMQGSGGLTNPLVRLWNARQTAGFFIKGQYAPGETTFFPYPHGESEIRIFLRLMDHLDVPSQGEHLSFPVTEDEQAAFGLLCQRHSLIPARYVCLHPGARSLERRWSPQKFAEIGDRLSEQGYRVVLTGSAAERELTAAVAATMQHPALDLSGQTQLADVALLIGSARLLVSNDTGVSHLAAAFQTPSVILFSASELHRWRPLNRQLHRIVERAQQASPEVVWQQIEILLQEVPAYAKET